MPRRDGTGPMGRGMITGRGLGLCSGGNISDDIINKTQKEILLEQKRVLESRLGRISKQLQDL